MQNYKVKVGPVIHKPTHKIFDEKGTPAIGLLQVRGSNFAILNLLENGKTIKSVKLYSVGIETILENTKESLEYIWRFYFGDREQKPVRIENIE